MKPPTESHEEIKTMIQHENSELSDIYVIGLQEMIKLDYKGVFQGTDDKVKNTWISIF